MGPVKTASNGVNHTTRPRQEDPLQRLKNAVDRLVARRDGSGKWAEGVGELRRLVEEVLARRNVDKVYGQKSASADDREGEGSTMLQQVGVYYVKAGEIVFSEDSGSLLIRPCSNPPSACSLESYLADIKKKVEHGGAVVDGTGELVSVESLAKDERDRLSEIFFASSEGNLIVLPND